MPNRDKSEKHQELVAVIDIASKFQNKFYDILNIDFSGQLKRTISQIVRYAKSVPSISEKFSSDIEAMDNADRTVSKMAMGWFLGKILSELEEDAKLHYERLSPVIKDLITYSQYFGDSVANNNHNKSDIKKVIGGINFKDD